MRKDCCGNSDVVSSSGKAEGCVRSVCGLSCALSASVWLDGMYREIGVRVGSDDEIRW